MSSNQLYSNNASSTLSSAISPSDVSFTIADASAFSKPIKAGQYILVTLESNNVKEIIKISQVSGNTLTVFGGLSGRAQENTSAAGFPSGTYVEARVTAGTLANFLNTSDYLPKLPSADGLSIPSLMTGTAYMAGVDDGGMPNLAYALSDTYWGFPGCKKIPVGTGIASGGTTTSANISNALAPTIGRFIIQFTSGSNLGYCRAVTGSTSGSVTWTTPLPYSIGNDSYEVYQSNYSVINALANIGDDALINALLFSN